MSGRAPPGTHVSAGRLRVDAARAVDKLRDYQLPDRAMWVLEVIRAAVLSGATAIRVHGDADDVIVSWEGPPIAAEDLTRLFDELVDPAPAPHRRQLRLLATGVNTALGLDPRWVDVVAIDGERARAVRFSPRIFRRDEDGSAPGLRSIAIEDRAPPRAPARGMIVHVKRLPFFGDVPILIGMGEPHELAMVRRSCDDLRVPLTIGRTTIGRDRSHVDLIRVELGEGLDGFVALTDASFAGEGGLEVAELGVRLARYSLPMGEGAWTRAPLRVLVDAPRMPTNASRGAVRLDEPPVREAMVRARAVLPELVLRVASAITGGDPRFTPAQRERLRASALALLAAVVGKDWRQGVRALATREDDAAALAPLASLPILRDALGRSRTPASFSARTGTDVVHYGDEPVPGELAPWLGEVLWAPPGDPSSILLGDARPPSAKKLVARARKYRVARASWLARAPSSLEVPHAAGHLLAVPLARPGMSLKSCAPPEAFELDGLEGQLVLCDPRAGSSSRVSLRIGGREIEALGLELPVPIHASAQCADLSPSFDHTSAARDEVFDALVSAVRAAAIAACEALSLRMIGKAKPGDRAEVRAPWIGSPGEHDRHVLAGILRGGVALALQACVGSTQGEEPWKSAADALRSSKSPLVDAAIWPTIGGEWASTRAIAREASRAPHAIGVTRLRGTGTAPSARSVYLVPEREQRTFRAITHRAAKIEYDRVLVRPPLPREARALARELCAPGSASLGLERDGHTIAVAWTSQASTLEVRHAGVTLTRAPLDAPGPCRVLIEDDRIVPNETWTAVRDGLSEPYAIEECCAELARAFIDALAGQAPPALVVGAERPENAELARAALLAYLVRAYDLPATVLGGDRLAALSRAPLVSLLGVKERVSLDAVIARFPEGPIPWVPRNAPSGLHLAGWHPLQAAETEVAALTRLLDRPLVCATDELERRRRGLARADALARHRQSPLHVPGPRGAPVVKIEGTGFRSAEVALALDASAWERVVILVEGRFFARREQVSDRPIDVLVDFDERAIDEDFRDLTPRGERALDHVRASGVRELLRAIAASDPRSLSSGLRASALLVAWSREIERAADVALAGELAQVRAFPTVQGRLASLAEAGSFAVRVATWDAAWLGPVEGEPSTELDGAVLRLPSDERVASELRAFYQRLAIGVVSDVTGAISRLQSERRVARGLARAPRLSRVVDPRFRYSLRELLAEDPGARDVLALGEAALDPERAQLVVFSGGVEIHTRDTHLLPRAIVAAECPLVTPGKRLDLERADRIDAAVRTVTARLVRRVVDDTPPDQLPDWVRHALRESCLHGGSDAYFDPLRSTPMFETTADGWATPDDLRAQRERFSAVWWTDRKETMAPLDPERIAIRIEHREAARLARWIPITDATAELALDAKARANRDRAPLAALELTEEERHAALAIATLELDEEGSAGVIGVMRPEASLRGLHLHRAMRPLGTADDPCAWPCVARVDDPTLTPNRAWDGAERDARLARIEHRVRKAVGRALLDALPFPRGKIAAIRVRAGEAEALGLMRGAVVEGVLWLEREPAPGEIAVWDHDGERTLGPMHRGRALPLSGTLWMHGARFDEASAPGLLTRLYEQLLRQAARRVPIEPGGDDAALAHVLHGLRNGIALAATMSEVMVPCFAGARVPIAEIAAHVLEGAPLAAPVIDDGSRVARELTALLEPKAPPVEEVITIGGAAMEVTDDSLARRLERHLAGDGISEVRIDRRARPLAANDGAVISLAGSHPLVRAIEESILTADPDADARVRLLAARALRERDPIAELERIERLLG